MIKFNLTVIIFGGDTHNVCMVLYVVTSYILFIDILELRVLHPYVLNILQVVIGLDLLGFLGFWVLMHHVHLKFLRQNFRGRYGVRVDRVSVICFIPRRRVLKQGFLPLNIHIHPAWVVSREHFFRTSHHGVSTGILLRLFLPNWDFDCLYITGRTLYLCCSSMAYGSIRDGSWWFPIFFSPLLSCANGLWIEIFGCGPYICHWRLQLSHTSLIEICLGYNWSYQIRLAIWAVNVCLGLGLSHHLTRIHRFYSMDIGNVMKFNN